MGCRGQGSRFGLQGSGVRGKGAVGRNLGGGNKGPLIWGLRLVDDGSWVRKVALRHDGVGHGEYAEEVAGGPRTSAATCM